MTVKDLGGLAAGTLNLLAPSGGIDGVILDEARALVAGSGYVVDPGLAGVLKEAMVAVKLRLGDQLLAARKLAEAEAEYKRIAEAGICTPVGEEAARKVFACVLQSPGSADVRLSAYHAWLGTLPPAMRGAGLLAIVEHDIRLSRTEKAAGTIDAILLGDYPPSTKALAGLYQVMSRLAELEYAEAPTRIEALEKQPAAAEIADRVAYCRAWCLIVNCRKPEGLAILDGFAAAFPGSEYIPRLTRLYRVAGK